MLLFPALLLSPLQELHIQYHYLLDLVVLRNLLPHILLQYLHIHPQIQRDRHILKIKINYGIFVMYNIHHIFKIYHSLCRSFLLIT